VQERISHVGHDLFRDGLVVLDKAEASTGQSNSAVLERPLELLQTTGGGVSGTPFAPASELDLRASLHLPEDFDNSAAASNSATRASMSSNSIAFAE
jgi:hypothetical protein